MSNSLFLDNLLAALYDPLEPVWLKSGGELTIHGDSNATAIIPSIAPGNFGSKAFRKEFDLRFAYVAGAMVGGISSAEMVATLAEAGLLGIFGSSGLPPSTVEDTVVGLQKRLRLKSFGCCLIHTPHDPALEQKLVDVFLAREMNLVEASAFLQLSAPLVQYRVTGLAELPDGSIFAPNRIMAKCSRLELAKRFFSPPPEKIVRALVEKRLVNEREAELARHIPMAQDLTAEADSGGHTDFRPAITLWPSMVQLAEELTEKFDYVQSVRVGAAGGLGTPAALLAAQDIGCSYFLTGSVNQSCVESGLPPKGRELLAKASQTDVAQAPAADMLEIGARVQVLKYGTLFAPRAQKLQELYRQYGSLDEIPAAERASIEEKIFRKPLDAVWEETEAFFRERDPQELKKAENPKHKMALVFRWYLGQASRWAIQGAEDRRTDWSIFAGPSIGAFNEWVAGTHYANPDNRKVVDVAMNLLYGLAILKRFAMARDLGLIPDGLPLNIKPLPPEELAEYISLI
ncbi:MAG: PfaD family polyunsaturated fatty acid/polyketide biosynthesis protein [Deltaproteobacteria bacterium]|jgi:PfaD family protein|nr:PfaD family polyunsaturated fatty acid/polyketide biosynthesis protein [Deltaproteobacteria bacterium]